jgi:hypothetical protein
MNGEVKTNRRLFSSLLPVEIERVKVDGENGHKGFS